MTSPLQRLYQTKLALLATISTVAGVALLLLGHWSGATPAWIWLTDLPVTDIGSALFTTGLIVVAFEYIDRKDADHRANERLRKVLHQEAPAIRDAVIDGFAFTPDALTNVASAQTLDRIVRNCLAIQLGDRTLADDLYTDLRHQVLRATERRFDMHISVALSAWDQGPATGKGAMFVATVRREYRVKLSDSVLRFACVSDQDEYRELLLDPTSTDAWYFEPIAGLDAASPEVFELVQFLVDGQPRPIRRTKRTGTQIFTVNTGGQADSPDEVQISYTYRVLVQRHSHLIYLDFGKPCKGVQVEFSYSDCGIRYVNALDFIASAQQARVTRSPKAVPTSNVTVGFDGWVFPKSGVAFVWVLDREIPGR
jgi:hypothetical protein